VSIDFIGSDFLRCPELEANPLVTFLNLRGDNRPDACFAEKVWRVLRYYIRLLRYAATSRAKIFHILWNNKFELLDRTALLIGYRLCGKRLVMTVHNVNIHKRDGNDSVINGLSLRMQYRLMDHLFVHTEQMKRELTTDFGVATARISVIPFGVNSTVPDTSLSAAEARVRLGLRADDKVVLFYGNIASYKGLEYLVEAVAQLAGEMPDLRLVVAGRPKGEESYWAGVERKIHALGIGPRLLLRIEYIPDADTEVYFKAADVLALPYTQIFQSGVLFLGYNFGLPVIASDVGSLRKDIDEGKTGLVCQAQNTQELAKAIRCFFSSALYRDLGSSRQRIRVFAQEHYSWSEVARKTVAAYEVATSVDASSALTISNTVLTNGVPGFKRLSDRTSVPQGASEASGKRE
jgi:glycosyltransferase involved in cell wall biosynthesis